jgi:DNA-binding MarR family transcriptional regulator
VLDVFQSKLVKRGVSLKALETGDPKPSGKEVRLTGTFSNGMSSENAKKVTASIMGVEAGVTDLGDDLGVTSSAASQLLERLVQQGLILRSEDPSDRRVKQIVLTERGRQALQEAIHARQGWLFDLAKTLSDSEKESIIAALNILIDKANHLGQPVAPRSSLF